MNHPGFEPFERLPLATRQAIDAVCSRFESALIHGETPDLPHDLAHFPADARTVLLTELIHLEWEYRHRRGESVDWASYRDRLPDDAALLSQLQDGLQQSSILMPPSTHRNTEPQSQTVTLLRDREPTLTGPDRSPLPTIPGYEIEGELGRGGMAVVYRAREIALKRPVAIKTILDTRQTGSLHRFRSEAEMAAGLQHPQIVHVFGFGEVDGQPYLVLELLEGGSLADRLRRETLPAISAAQTVAMLARAMAHAHDRQVIHRDLKPSNVLFDHAGNLKIVDFGLAKAANSDHNLTLTGMILGTPCYMAPEQANSEDAKIGPAADIYALGAILYECLTGRPPFKGATVNETLRQVMTDEPPSLRLFDAKIPRDLESICLKCLEKDIGRRYSSASDLAADLDRFIDGRPILAKPIGPAIRTTRWIKRHPAMAMLLLLMILTPAAIATGVGLLLYSQESERGRQLAVESRDRLAQAADATQRALAATESARADLADADYLSRVGLAYRDWLQDRTVAATDRLMGCPPDVRGWEWSMVHRIVRNVPWPWSQHDRDVWTVSATPDGNRLVSADHAGRLVVWGTRERVIRKQEFQQPIWAIAVSPNGKTLAIALRDRGVLLQDLETGTQIQRLKCPNQIVNALAFSPDGTRLATAGGTTGRNIVSTNVEEAPNSFAVRVWDCDTGTVRQTLMGHTDTVFALAFRADGAKLLTGQHGLAIGWELASGRKTEYAVPDQWVRAVQFGRPGSVLVASLDSRVEMFEESTGNRIGFLPHPAGVQAMIPLPGGRLATGSKDHSIRIWDLQSLQEISRFRGHTGDVTCLTRAGEQVLVSGSLDRSIRPWNLAFQQEAVTTQSFSRPQSLQIDHAGKTLYLGNSGGGLHIYRIFGRQLLHRIPVSDGYISAISVRGDDAEVAVADTHGVISICDPITGQRLRQFPSGFPVVSALTYLPRGDRLISAHPGNGLAIWNAATGERIGTLPGRSQLALAFDGSILATIDGDEVIWVNPHTGEIAQRYRPAAAPEVLAISPDGRRVAIVDRNRVVSVVDRLALTEPPIQDRSFAGTVLLPRFTADGRRVVLSGDDGIIRVMDARTGREALMLLTNGLNVLAFDLSISGQSLVAALGDGSLRWWSSSMSPPKILPAPGAEGLAMVGDTLIARCSDGTKQAWTLPNGTPCEVPPGELEMLPMLERNRPHLRIDLLIDRVRIVPLTAPPPAFAR
ncbi:WD40 repeat domain-containing serine/threonine protein kinase [Tuwongella immobilis]|uniref:non-specific serine/threonine protein kinase n=1 Tax=Tuwongella immobilis TaxID=692036 RepID=A0A6C2YSQ0_9BACT|nr:protein kinase [Tuwongella immobilis]VIP04357.1 wd40 repeat-containing protein : Uncultured bacterium genome assembly Metasoil_fosmids_resub OS=uncultured bacterium PE=4 SV=1: Pkinase: WD40: WD40: WD40 [Tuwongella immobilis]VTS06076.1 wd40 repeat-containing protein : Uncultured bacterium genome assembly Metasoil_fosmids_resub OS=uncultured bacterium PE=4 SV=1: Pkinase: WD40: WD40: WD40 [Tuwongella immobilis]